MGRAADTASSMATSTAEDSSPIGPPISPPPRMRMTGGISMPVAARSSDSLSRDALESGSPFWASGAASLEPALGARCERRIVIRHLTILLQHYDLPSLLAGKLHAAITRKYAKGRDWYDLMWYLSQRPPVAPNLPFLQAALDQTQGAGRRDALAWKQLVQARLTALDMRAVSEDVGPFLERPQDAALLTRENLSVMLG
jgi:hypothetical protein